MYDHLYMNSSAQEAVGGLLHPFRESRVRMNNVSEVCRSRLQAEHRTALADEISRMISNNVDPEDFPILLLCH